MRLVSQPVPITAPASPRPGLLSWPRDLYAACCADPGFSADQVKRVYGVYRVVLPLYAGMAALSTVTMWRRDWVVAALWGFQLVVALGTYIGLERRRDRAHRVMQVGFVTLFAGMAARIPHIVLFSSAADANLHSLTSAFFATAVVTHTVFTIDTARRLNRVFLALLTVMAAGSLVVTHHVEIDRVLPVLRFALCGVAMIALTAFMSELQREHSQLQTEHKVMEHLALSDALTGLCNRRAFEANLGREIARAQRYGGALSVIMLDVDHFKQINDTYGHDAGDKALVGIAATLHEQLRASDEAARWAGDEFVIVLPATPVVGALLVAERIRAAIAGNTTLGFGPVTVSLGVVELERGVDDLASFMRRADQALYSAKGRGRNRAACLQTSA